MDEIITKISNLKWKKIGKWHHNILSSEIYGEGASTKNCKKEGYPFTRSRNVWFDSGEYYDLEKDWKNTQKIIAENLSKNQDYINEYGQDCLKKGENLIRYSKGLKDINPKRLSNQELGKKYSEIITEIKKYQPFIMSMHVFDEYLTNNFNESFEKYAKKHKFSEKDIFEVQTVLTVPFRRIFVLEEKLDLLKIGLEIKNKKLNIKDKPVKTMIRNHAEKYSWMGAVTFEKEPYDYKHFEDKLKVLLKTDVKKEYVSIMEREEEMIIKQNIHMQKIMNENQEFHRLVKDIQLFGFLRSFRIDTTHIAYVNGWHITEEITKRLNLKKMDIKHLDSKEVTLALGKNLDHKKLIKERENEKISIMIEDKRYELIGQDRVIKVKNALNIEEVEKSDFVKGQTAHPGLIMGLCKVLHKTDDIAKVDKGDIIIVSMTDPNYVPAMEKASAFVTDFGGILCHAAIISREMKKPCVIGTKNATKIFKDNDYIEVNATTGIVRKIIRPN